MDERREALAELTRLAVEDGTYWADAEQVSRLLAEARKDFPTRESINRRPAKDGDEYDAFTHWRHLLCCFNRAGIAKANKQRHNRRTRRQLREQLNEERP